MNQDRKDFLNFATPPVRLSLAETAWFLGFTDHDISDVALNLSGDSLISPRQPRDTIGYPHRVWNEVWSYFRPGSVIETIRIRKSAQGLSLPLDQSDLLPQLKAKSFFPPAPRQGHQNKLGKKSRGNEYCRGIDLNILPDLGLRPVSVEVWEQSLHTNGDSSERILSAHEWIDSRKGDLFAIVDALMENESESTIPSDSSSMKREFKLRALDS